MSKKKVVTKREVALPHVSIKCGKVGMYARFSKYADRAILCKANMVMKDKYNGYLDRWSFHESFETKALCHPGDPVKELGPDTFNEGVGMDIAMKRLLRKFNSMRKSIANDVAYFEEKLAEGRKAVEDIDNALAIFQDQYDQYREDGLIVCEDCTQATPTSV